MTPLRDQLLRWLLVPTLALWLLGVGASYLGGEGEATEAYDRTLLASAMVIAGGLGLQGDRVVVDLPRVALEMLRTDAHDKVYYRVDDVGTHRLITGEPRLRAASGVASAPVFTDDLFDDEAIRSVSLRHEVVDGERSRATVVQVAETLGARRGLVRRIAGQSAAIQLGTMSVAAALIGLGVWRGLWPLRHLGREVRARHVFDNAPLDADAVPRDVAPLIHAINAHTERQREATDLQARFLANASHQLKAPLTVLRAQVEHALRQTEVGAMRDVVVRLHDTTDTTGRLVGQLLALARSEPGGRLEMAETDLTALARAATFDLLLLARAKRIDLGFEGEAPVMVNCEWVLLRELVTNLVHNAITYTQAGGAVTVSVAMRGAHPSLRVADNGPGIARAERQRVLERFYRLPGSGAQGSGLGLAIVKEICARHAIWLALDDAPGEVAGPGPGLRVDLEWPAVAVRRTEKARAVATMQ